MQLDTNSAFGQRVQRRLVQEPIVWLTTVDTKEMPQPRPVWFLWEEESFLIYSRPETAKLDHIARNPNVSLHFDGDGRGGDIIVFTGTASLAPDAPPANAVAGYKTKYSEGFARLNMTPQQFADTYSVAIRVLPSKVRGH